MILALALLLQADPAVAELEKLARAYSALETVRVVYDGKPHPESKIVGAKLTCTLDRPGRRAHLLAAHTEDGVAREAHLVMEGLVFRTWSPPNGEGIRFDLGAALATMHQETQQAEAELRKLLPPALALAPDMPLVPGFFLDLSPLTQDEEGGKLRFALAMFQPGGRLPWARMMSGAVLGDDAADAVFRLPGKTWRLDRATGLIRSLKVETEGKAIEIVLASVDTPASFPDLKLPESFKDRVPPAEMLDWVLRIRADTLGDLLGVFRGAWAGLPAETAERAAPLLRRWVGAYMGGLRDHQTRLWISAYAERSLPMKPAPKFLGNFADGATARLLDSLKKGAEQERAQQVQELKKLATQLTPEKPLEAAKALDDLIGTATAFESLDLPAWTRERLKATFLQELDRAGKK